MSVSDDRIAQLVQDVLDRVQSRLGEELRTLSQGLRAHTAEERETAAREARSDAEAAATALASGAIAAERSAFEERLAAGVRETRETADREWGARLAEQESRAARTEVEERTAELVVADRLLEGVRALDAAGSLSEALDVLARVAHVEAGRAAVLLVRGETLAGWAHDGFPPDIPPAREIVLPLADAGLLGHAARQGVSRSTGGADGRRDDEVPAPFSPGSEDRVGLAVPVSVDGRTVALLYADDAGPAPRTVPSAWPEHVEVLARHAGRCLETLTARQAFAPRGGTSDGDAARREDEAAERYARLLVSEIKLYHEPVVNEGCRDGNLRQRLAPEIERARVLYEERVPVEVRARGDFFERELIRTLAGGNAARLGQAG